MKTTVKKTETTHVVAFAVEDVTDADVMTVPYTSQQFYPDHVIITYTHDGGQWCTNVDATVSGPRKIKAGRSSVEMKSARFGTRRWDDQPPEWVQALIDEYRPTWTPQGAQA